MSKVLVLPDIHGRNFWRKAIADNIGKVDKVIFLGDYLDPYPEEIQMAPELMDCGAFDDVGNLLYMLNDIVSLKKNEPDKYILLTGNHTDSYIWSKFHAATRTDYGNWEKYHKFFLENLDLFNLVYIENNVIFSHAGISKGWAKQFDEEISVWDLAEAMQGISLEKIDPKDVKYLGHISHYRGGDMFYGSCEWADLREHIDMKNFTKNNLIPLGKDGIYQIFGHTQLKEPLITSKWACLDCKKGFIIDTITHEINQC